VEAKDIKNSDKAKKLDGAVETGGEFSSVLGVRTPVRRKREEEGFSSDSSSDDLDDLIKVKNPLTRALHLSTPVGMEFSRLVLTAQKNLK